MNVLLITCAILFVSWQVDAVSFGQHANLYNPSIDDLLSKLQPLFSNFPGPSVALPKQDCITPTYDIYKCYSGRQWRYEAKSGRCHHQSVCGLHGQNKYDSMEECIANCVPSDCISPDFETLCYTGDMWRFDPVTGKCNKRGVCENTGPNKFESEAACLQVCTYGNSGGVVDNGECSAPPTLSTCIPNVDDKAWVYNAITETCEFIHVCPFPGPRSSLPNKYSCQADCQARCEGQCSASAFNPAHSCPLYNQPHAWRFNTVSETCEYSPVCPATGANRYLTRADCEQACGVDDDDDDNVEYGECSAPPILPEFKCLDQRAWVFSNETEQCEYTQVCPLAGPNKYLSETECEEKCGRKCSAPAYQPNFNCLVAAYAWRYNGHACEYTTVCPEVGANKYESKEECEESCGSSTLPPSLHQECYLKPDDGLPQYYKDSSYLPERFCSPQMRYFFNYQDGKCHKFYYYGCYGYVNENNFFSKRVCELACTDRCNQ